MRCTILASAVLLLAWGTARAEYMPGFNLYRHTADANLIVLARVDRQGTATILEVLKGRSKIGAKLEVDRKVLVRTRRWYPGQPEQAFLFLSKGRLVLDEAGIGWIEKGTVRLLPDNWGWGICYPENYRDPTPEQFRKSVAVALADAAEVARIVKLPRGADSVKAASALLRRPREGIDWYVSEFHHQFSVGSTVRGEGYLEELAFSFWRARNPEPPGKPVPPQETAAWVKAVAALSPGPVRRVHLWVLSGADLRPEDFPVLETCFATAAGSREMEAAGSAMLKSDPDRSAEVLSAELDVAKPALSNMVLRLLSGAAAAGDIEHPLVVGLAAELVPSFVAAPRTTETGNLGYAIVHALGKTHRVADLPQLLALSRSEHGCHGQALVELHRLAQKGWKAADYRWDDHLSTLTELPTGK